MLSESEATIKAEPCGQRRAMVCDCGTRPAAASLRLPGKTEPWRWGFSIAAPPGSPKNWDWSECRTLEWHKAQWSFIPSRSSVMRLKGGTLWLLRSRIRRSNKSRFSFLFRKNTPRTGGTCPNSLYSYDLADIKGTRLIPRQPGRQCQVWWMMPPALV